MNNDLTFSEKQVINKECMRFLMNFQTENSLCSGKMSCQTHCVVRFELDNELIYIFNPHSFESRQFQFYKR